VVLELAQIVEAEPGYAGLLEYAIHLSLAGWDAETAIEKVAGTRELSEAADVASLLHWRLARTYGDVGTLYATAAAGVAMPARTPTEWAFLVYGPALGEAARAVVDQIEERVGTLAERAEHEPWAHELPRGPEETRRAAIASIAAYREITGFKGAEALGPEPPATAITAHGAWRVARDTLSYADRSAYLERTVPAGAGLIRELGRTPAIRAEREDHRSNATARVARGERLAGDPAREAGARTSYIARYAVTDAVQRMSQPVRTAAVKHFKQLQDSLERQARARNRSRDEAAERDRGYGIDR